MSTDKTQPKENSSVTGDGTKQNKDKSAKPAEISFVVFDGSSSDANRKAVRKQAALSSAAARKATIAKKIARQKELEKKRLTGNEEVVDTTITRENTKRKRVQPSQSSQSSQPWQHGISIIQENVQQTTSPENTRKRSRPRMVSAYLSPPLTHSTVSSEDTPEDTAQLEIVSSMTSDEDVPSSYSRQIVPLKATTWAVLSDDYNHNEESHLPPTPESLASPATASASLFDPFNNYPVQYHPVYDRLLHHMLTNFAPRGWPALNITTTEGLAWERFMTLHALAEPALFLVRVLFASGDMIRIGALEPRVQVALRSLAIKAINDALTDPKRSISDGMILAVGRIALSESFYGDRVAANSIHRPAQRRMIDLRGGMNALGFPPLVRRLMRWSDKVMSLQSNTTRFLPDEEDEGNSTFDMSQSVGVLDQWVPQQARAMRKKIAIADLIT